MAKAKIYLDPIGNTLNIWWGNPKDAHTSEEVDDPNRNDVIVKDKQGKPISLEIIGLFPKELNISDLAKRLIGKKVDQPYLLSA
jgi:hypothetical protein